MIEHKTVTDLLRVAILVYDYGDIFHLNSDETIETFASKNINTLKISNTGKQILSAIAKDTPSSKVCYFINDKETDLQGCITINENDKCICVIFRGSTSLTDWYYDFQIETKCLNTNIMVHSGFYNQLHDTNIYNSMLLEIKKQLETYPDFIVYVTGHSLGAALSTLFGYLLSQDINNKIIIVSFASPRIGNANFKKSFDEKTNLEHYRITNNRDIVTGFPIYNYTHVGNNIRLSENIVTTILDYQDVSWHDFTILRCWNPFDHSCELYYKNLINNPW
jgi:predicted lipase